MNYDIEMLKDGIKNTEKALMTNPLPSWDLLPQFDLYMDQVIILLGKYLSAYTVGQSREKFITAAMINNYVKLKIMPAPIKKKYSRVHLAYLIMICSLKQTLSMATIQKIIPSNLSEEKIHEIYSKFLSNQKLAVEHTKQQIKEFTSPVTALDEKTDIDDLVMQVAIFSNITKILTERLCNAAAQTDDLRN